MPADLFGQPADYAAIHRLAETHGLKVLADAAQSFGATWRGGRVGALAGVKVSPDGQVVGAAEWNARQDDWLPSAGDRAFVASLMGRVVEQGKFANWIAPPMIGINRQPVDFDYVRFN